MKKVKKILSIMIAASLVLGLWPHSGAGSVKAAADPTTAHPNAAVYEAENATLSGGARTATDHADYSGSSFVGGFDGNGSGAVTFNFNVSSAGTYYLDFRYAAGDLSNATKNRTMGYVVNGNETTLTFPGTEGTWNTWEELIVKANLNSGNNTIVIKNITSNNNNDCINLDKLSVWKYSDNPTIDGVTSERTSYTVSVGFEQKIIAYSIDSNGVRSSALTDFTLTSSNTGVVKTSGTSIIGVAPGNTRVTINSNGMSASFDVTVINNPGISADCAKVTKKVDPSLFGYILTPNYDVPQSRMTLLGPILNRETIPVQNFQAIGDMDGSYFKYEGSIMERQVEAFRRAKKAGLKYYFLVGHNASWASANGNPVDTNLVKNAEQLAAFKQYAKDMFTYMRDHGAIPDFADLTNEYWTGLEPTYRVVWEALREVYPDFVPAVGPGAVGYSGIPDYYIPFCAQNELTNEGPSWHEFWTGDRYVTYSQLKRWYDNIANIQNQYPDANGKYIIWEENNAGSTNGTDWARSMANVVRVGVDYNIKGCLEGNNWNGMSDLLTTKTRDYNNSDRRPVWWAYYTFAQLSGDYVEVETKNADESFTGCVSVDKNNIKIIVAKNGSAGAVDVQLKNVKLNEELEINVYKLVDSENHGLAYDRNVNDYTYSGGNLSFSVPNVGANDTIFVDVKDKGAKPGFILPLTPDDGQAADGNPTLTWTESIGADSYSLKVSEKEDLSSPIVDEKGLTGTSYTITKSLEDGKLYYWMVTADNANGSTAPVSETKYSFLYKNSANVPGQFGPYLPSVDAYNEDLTCEIMWSTAYNAQRYHVIVSEHEDFSDPVVDTDVNNVRGSNQFGGNTQAYYRFRQGELKPTTKYYWKVYAVNASGERPMNGPLHWFTTKAEGDSPTGFKLTYPEDFGEDVDERAVLTWERSYNAFFYELRISKNEDMSNPILVRPTIMNCKYIVEQNILEPGETYYWTVKAYTKDKSRSTDSTSGVCSFKVKDTPGAPLLYVHVPEDHSVRLRFKEITCDGYAILYGTAPGRYTGLVDNISSDGDDDADGFVEYTVDGLNSGVKYYFAVVAYNDYGTSSIWNERPETPVSSNGAVEADDTAGLPVIDPQDVSNSHNIYYVPPSPTPEPTTDPNAAPGPGTDKGASSDKATDGKDGKDGSGNSAASGLTESGTPKRVKIKKAAYKKGKLVITWKKLNGVKGYVVQIAKNKKFKKVLKKVTIRKGTITSKKIKIGKKKYFIRVRAYVMDGKKKVYGKWSKVKKLK